MNLKIEVDDKDFQRVIRDIEKAIDRNWQEAGRQFKSTTPKRSGNARSKTKISDTAIVADYAYAQRLDEGYSKQAPAGMSGPTIRDFADNLTRDIGRL